MPQDPEENVTPQDDSREPAPAGEEPEPPPAGEEPEPAPAGEEPEPAPAGEEPEPPPEGEEPPPADSSSDDSEDDKNTGKSKAGGGSGSSSSSSGDSSDSEASQTPQFSESDVQAALTSAFRAHGVDVGSDDISIYMSGGNMKVSLRLSIDALPLPQVPQSTTDVPASGVAPAKGLLLGQVQIFSGVARVGLHIVNVETSEVVQTGQGTASGDSIDMVQAAAEDALAALTILNTV